MRRSLLYRFENPAAATGQGLTFQDDSGVMLNRILLIISNALGR